MSSLITIINVNSQVAQKSLDLKNNLEKILLTVNATRYCF